MKIGLHYHIPFYFEETTSTWQVPAYFGVFLKGLLDQVDKLVVFGYTALPSEIPNCDYPISSDNFEFINLGPHNSVPRRVLKSFFFLKEIYQRIDLLDSILIRTPTPMVIPSSFIKSEKIHLLIVGEYDVAINSQVGLKGFFLKSLYKWMRQSEVKLLKRNLSFTNSAKILEDYSNQAIEMKLIKTTTISIHDAYPREDTFQNEIINLLYAGRLDPNKNIVGILKSVAYLNSINVHKYKLNLVYLNNAFGEDYKIKLEEIVKSLGISDDVIFHGQKRVGDELNQMYRNADIFLLVSLTEGFPRVIWESMINNCPVIATKVGSIPYYLSDQENAILIDPSVDSQITEAILLLVKNGDLRRKIIRNALELVKENTIEIQTKMLLSMIKPNKSAIKN
jgi:glycosyltransferase involved in cell wall biosynthesis